MRWGLALTSVLCLCASAPPVWFPGAGLLVVVGWMAFYAIISEADGRRRKRTAYLVGLVHMLYFSCSLWHVVEWAYICIGIIGGLYYVITAVWTRALSRYVPGSVAFGCGLAGACWLRANFVEIQDAHAQPAHSLYQWPVLLGGLRWGGDVFVNLLLGVIAGAVVDCFRAWRVGRPAFARSRAMLVGVVVVYGASLIPVDPAPVGPTRVVSLLLIEPRMSPLQFRQSRAAFIKMLRSRVIAPTLLAAGPQAPNPPDLVVWPESIAVQTMLSTAGDPQPSWLFPEIPRFTLAPKTRLIQGSVLQSPDGSYKVAALQVDHRLGYLGHHEKQKLVPGGEHPPFLGWLPKWIGDGLKAAFEARLGPLPDTDPGRPRPLLHTAAGVPFGVVVCFDNAFPGPFERLARDGAAFILVISNENWYHGGSELDQMHAMTVCRALETRMSVVRCTVDGVTMVVGPDGRVQERLPFPIDFHDRGEKLQVELTVPVEPLRTVPPLRQPVTWLVLLSLLGVITPLLRFWGTLVRARVRRTPAL